MLIRTMEMQMVNSNSFCIFTLDSGLDHEVSGEEVASQDDSFHCFTGHSSNLQDYSNRMKFHFSDSVFCVAWSPVGDLTVVSGGQDDVGYLWKV